LALQFPADSYWQSTPDKFDMRPQLLFRANARLAEQVRNGTGKILYHKGTIFAALPL